MKFLYWRKQNTWRWIAALLFLVSIILPTLLAIQPANAAPTSFVTRSGSQLLLDGQPFRFSGPNFPWMALDEVTSQLAGASAPDYPTSFRVDDALDTVKEMGGTVIRAHTLGISYGCGNGAGNGGITNGKCAEPMLDQFNEEAFRHIDYAIYAAGQRGIRLIVPLVDEYHYFHGGKQTFTTWLGKPESDFYNDGPEGPVRSAFKRWINKLLNRVNTYNNMRYRDDPTILAWETGNELNPTDEWTQDIAYYIRTQDTRHLIMDGNYGINQNLLSVPYIDLYSNHFYTFCNAPTDYRIDLTRTPDTTRLASDAATVAAANKVYYVGEYGSTLNNANLGTFLSNIEGHPVAGDSYWVLFPHGDSRNYPQHFDGQNCAGQLSGFTLHYPGDDANMAANVQSLRTHAYNMRNISPIPAHDMPAAPAITGISGATLQWRGAAAAVTYSVESSTTGAGGPFSEVTTSTNRPSDNPGSWVDPTAYTGAVWYRVRGWNLDGLAGPYSPVAQKGAALPAPTSTLWPTNATTPTLGAPTQTFTPPPPTGTATSMPQPAGSFWRGININGSAVTIGNPVNSESHTWLDYTTAKQQGFGVNAAALPDTKNLTPNPAVDSDTKSMLNSLVYTPADLNFTQRLPNGQYQVYLWTMENYASNVRSWSLRLEEITAARSLGNLALNEWAVYGPFDTTVNDGTLNIDLIHGSGNPMLMGLEIYQLGSASTPTFAPTATQTQIPTNTPGPSTFYKGINFNGSAVHVEGNAWLGQADAMSNGLSVGASTRYGTAGNSSQFVPAADGDTLQMVNALLWAPSPAPLNIAQSLPNGTYDVYVYEVEGYADNTHAMNLNLEGLQAAQDVGLLPLNHWAKYGPYTVKVSDGVLNVDLMPTSAGAQISGLSIFSVGGTPPTSTPIPPTNTPIPHQSTFYKGINFNGNAASIEGNAWIGYGDALASGLSVGTSTRTGTAGDSSLFLPAADTDTKQMLNTLLWAPSPAPLNIAQSLPNGTYDVYVYEVEGYADNTHAMNLNLEGLQVAQGVGLLPLNHWAKYGPYTVKVSDGVLNVDLMPTSAGAQISGLSMFRIADTELPTPTSTLVPAGSTFYRGINLNGSAVTVEGYNWLGYSTALANGFSVGASVRTGMAGNSSLFMPAADSDTLQMVNTLLWAQSSAPINLMQTIPDGAYDVYLYEVEGYADNTHAMNLNLEGVQMASSVGLLPLNHWAKYGPYRVAVTDGVLNIDLIPTSAGAQISGLSIFSVTGGNPTNTPAPTAVSETNTPTPTATSSTATFYKGINLNGSSVTIEGNAWVNQTLAMNNGFSVGASTRTGTAGNSSLFMPAADGDTLQMVNTLLWAQSPAPLNLAQSLPSGAYDVYVYEVEGYADNTHAMNLNLEGLQAGSGIGLLPLNHWAKYGPYRVTVMDGVLNIDLIPTSAGAQISGLAIFSVASGSPTNTPEPTVVPATLPSTSEPTFVPPTNTATAEPTFIPPPNTGVPATATPTRTLTPTATPNLATLLRQLVTCAVDKGTLNSLRAKLISGQYQAFISQLKALRGKKITETCADELIALADFLKTHTHP